MRQDRIEKDMLGKLPVDADSLTGIHTARAIDNFGTAAGVTNKRLLSAFGMVKLACLRTNNKLGYIDPAIANAISQAATELAEYRLTTPNIPTALQGGAGTSTNMYVNELLANRALELLAHPLGCYDIISPLDHVNLHQSTNDTYPTALRVAAMLAFKQLEESISQLADICQQKEKQFADIIKVGRTQLQDAVLTTVGRQFGCYAEAFSKDRWRISKCCERLRVINLGGTAIGTGLGAPRKYIFTATEELRNITSLPLARAENLIQATQNCDDFVEVSGIAKALASNLLKISNDLRLLSSGPQAGLAEIKLPPVQAGSSIMPGKVNPVIAEFVGQTAIQAFARDSAITIAASSGQLELNAFMPLIAENLLAMLDELIAATTKFRTHLMCDIQANPQQCTDSAHSSTAIITAFINKIGYEKASQIATRSIAENKTIRLLLLEENLCTDEEYEFLTSPESLLALGFKG